MTKKNKILTSILALAALGLSTSAFSGGPETPLPVDDSGFIVGAQLGYAETNWDEIHHNAFNNFAIAVGDDGNVGVRPYLGYAFNRFFAVEMGWTYLGDVSIYRYDLINGNRRMTTIYNDAYDVSLRFSAPLNDYFGVFGRVGLSYLVSDNSLYWRVIPFIPATENPLRKNTSNLGAALGAGLYYNVTPHLRMELSWTHFDSNSSADDSYQPNPDFFAVGLSYRFGGHLF